MIILILFLIAVSLWLPQHNHKRLREPNLFIENIAMFTAGIAGVLCLIVIILWVTIPFQRANILTKYEMLNYEIENPQVWDDLGITKKAIFDDITEWNVRFSEHEVGEDSLMFWVFYPPVYRGLGKIDVHAIPKSYK